MFDDGPGMSGIVRPSIGRLLSLYCGGSSMISLSSGMMSSAASVCMMYREGRFRSFAALIIAALLVGTGGTVLYGLPMVNDGRGEMRFVEELSAPGE